MIRPRPYQITAVENTLNLLFDTPGSNPVVAIPPGGGKSSIISWTQRAIIQRVPLAKMITLTHVKELVEQDHNELTTIWPDAPVGIYAAGLNTKQSRMPITIGLYQSVVRNLIEFGKISALFVDEAHLISPNAETSYQRIIEHFRALNPDMPVIGYSATPWRMKHGKLTESGLFNCTAFDNTQREDFNALLDDGYLVPLIPKSMSFQFDVSNVRVTAGDFNLSDLQAVVNKEALTRRALEESLQVAANRHHWLMFCSGIAHVESVAGMLAAWGERVVYVHSKMPVNQRDDAIQRFKLGHARQIVSDGILTTGFNSPWIDCIIDLKPTSSPGLHVQKLGRGLRAVYAPGYNLDEREGRLAAILENGKRNCLVLDYGGNSDRLGPINDPVIPTPRGKGTGEVPVKLCPECGTYVHAAVRFCTGIHWDGRPCEHEFEFETKLEGSASTTELIARDEPQLVWFKVERVEYDVYNSKKTGIVMMRVHYYCGIRRFSELVCMDHTGYAHRRAVDWWHERLPHYPPPPDTATGMSYVQNLPKPTDILVWVNQKYPQIMTATFDGSRPTIDVKLPAHGSIS